MCKCGNGWGLLHRLRVFINLEELQQVSQGRGSMGTEWGYRTEGGCF